MRRRMLAAGALVALLAGGSLVARRVADRVAPTAARAHAGAADGTVDVRERWAARAAGLELSVVAGMAEAADGSIWISDGMLKTVLRVDADGRGGGVVARSGDGPGEVASPSRMAALPDGGVALIDMGRTAIHLFGADGKFSRSVQMEEIVTNPKGFVVLPSGEMVVSGGLYSDAPGAVHVFGPDGRIRRSFHPRPVTRDPRAAQLVAGGALALHGGRLLVSQAAPHRLVSYGLGGGSGTELATDPSLVPPMGDEFIRIEGRYRVFDWYFKQSRGVFPLPGGRILNVVWDRKASRSVWEVYTAAGKLSTRRILPRAYEPWAMTRDGDVLASYTDPETDEPVVARLAVSVR